MSIDSTAELLFNITANADDATENIAKFRTLMGKDLSDLSGEFQTWSDEVLGEITTVQAAMTAGFAVMAAGMVAVAAGAHEALGEYEKYADAVSHAMKVTGMGAEQLSALHSAAAKNAIDYDTLVNGLVKLEVSAVKAAQGGKTQMDAFHALGITDQEVIAGQKDMYPLLMKVADGFHNNASAAQKAAFARALIAKGGPELVDILSKGSAYFKENSEEAERLGLILTNSDVVAFRAFRLEQKEMQEQMEALSVSVGRTLIPILSKLTAAMGAAIAATKVFAGGGLKGFTAPLVFLKEYGAEMAKIQQQMTAAAIQPPPDLIKPEKIKVAKQEFEGLTSMVDSLSSKLASLGGNKWEELMVEVGHYNDQLAKATAELDKLKKAGTITAESATRETAQLAQIPALIARIIDQTAADIEAENVKAWGEAVLKSIEANDEETDALKKAGEERMAVTREIDGKLSEQGEQSYALQRARWVVQQDKWIADLAKKTQLTEEQIIAIDQITTAGLTKIDKAESDAWAQELAKMREHLESLVAVNTTEQQKILTEKQKAIEQANAAEDAALRKVESDEAKANEVRQMYALIRTQIDQKYANDLQTLLNSQGWQGVFGTHFAQGIQQNKQLMQQWATSTNQSILMVQVTLETLQEQAKKTFDGMVQGMGSAITQAFITQKSIGAAMQQVLASTLESIAGQAAVQAIYASALGFLDLAEQDYPGATAAFTSAAIFGSVAAAAAITGRAISTPAGGSGGGSGAGGGSGSGTRAGSAQAGSVAGSGSSPQQGTVTINIAGHVIGQSGAAQLADILNQAVYGNDVTLYASHTKSGVPLG